MMPGRLGPRRRLLAPRSPVEHAPRRACASRPEGRTVFVLTALALAGAARAAQPPYGVTTVAAARDVYPILIQPESTYHGLTVTIYDPAGQGGVEVFRGGAG